MRVTASLSSAELECAENNSDPSYFLQWLGYEAKAQKVPSMPGGVFTAQLPASCLQSELCAGESQEGRREEAESQGKGEAKGAKAAQGEAKEPPRLAAGGSSRIQQVHPSTRRHAALHQLWKAS